ncbi:hypothetical protein JCM19236_2948 [Vibrio sp. JCM 19236]|nr:hypothetical protein JCM19236_2948 [Vibrio sp. JCM 19236]
MQSESSFPIYQGIVVAISAGAILLAPRLVERWGKKRFLFLVVGWVFYY